MPEVWSVGAKWSLHGVPATMQTCKLDAEVSSTLVTCGTCWLNVAGVTSTQAARVHLAGSRCSHDPGSRWMASLPLARTYCFGASFILNVRSSTPMSSAPPGPPSDGDGNGSANTDQLKGWSEGPPVPARIVELREWEGRRSGSADVRRGGLRGSTPPLSGLSVTNYE